VASDRPAARASAPAIAVFGSSEPRPGDDLYDVALHLGGLLARARCTVITGAYGGVMEGASRGAYEAGGRTLGVPCEIFDARAPNAYLTDVVPTKNLHERTRELVERASGFVVLPGKAGTLAELAWLWALHRAGCLGGRPVVLLGPGWQSLIDLLERSGMLEPSQILSTQVARTPEEAVELLGAALPDGGGRNA
jgi:uncharacterized protein (TIGR00730 family)